MAIEGGRKEDGKEEMKTKPKNVHSNTHAHEDTQGAMIYRYATRRYSQEWLPIYSNFDFVTCITNIRIRPQRPCCSSYAQLKCYATNAI